MLDIHFHKSILIQLLKEVFTHPHLGPLLGFKGGTAAMLFYNLDRFSVDLDFDLLNTEKIDDIMLYMPLILQQYGVIKQSLKKRYTCFFLLAYDALSMNIKVEINIRSFNSQYELHHYLGIPMRVMVKPDMFAHKLAAMSERLGKTNRDIYDIHFFLKHHWPINQRLVEERFNLSFNDVLTHAITQLEKLPNRGILSGIGELLSSEKKQWVKENLKSDTVFLLRVLARSQGLEPRTS